MISSPRPHRGGQAFEDRHGRLTQLLHRVNELTYEAPHLAGLLVLEAKQGVQALQLVIDRTDQWMLAEVVSFRPGRASATNMILRTGWDPRAEWELATPGFPLDGGVEQWEQEVRGTSIARLLSERAAEAASPESL